MSLNFDLKKHEMTKKDVCFARIRGIFRADEDGSFISPHTCGHLVGIFFAEIIGTFILLFAGCLGTELLPGEYFQESAHLITCIIFGMAVMIAIQVVGHVSEAHINPSVSLCALMMGRIRLVGFIIYFCGQMIGGLLGVGMLKIMTPAHAWNDSATYGCCIPCLTIPHHTLWDYESFLGEFLVTAILILVVLGIWDKRNQSDNAAPIKLGLTVTTMALAMGPFTGASMNPARSFAPALWEMNFKKHWLYWVGPLTGSFAATLLYMIFLEKDYGTLTYVYGKQESPINVDQIVSGIRTAWVEGGVGDRMSLARRRSKRASSANTLKSSDA